jgi:prepilin-type N-terminal cleavage/methylation domain-containing protein
MRLQQRAQRRAKDGFTLVEMIGVLAIISILASLLIPRVFQAIGDSKISNASTTCNSIKAAVNEYYGKYGLIAGPQGGALTFDAVGNTIAEDWDLEVLVAEGIAEKPFAVRIGNGKIGSANTGSRLRVIKLAAYDPDQTPIGAAGDGDKGAYDLDGTGNANDINGALLVEAVVEDVDDKDAKDLNDRLDGTTLGAALGAADAKGRVKYEAAGADGKTRLHIYLAHR